MNYYHEKSTISISKIQVLPRNTENLARISESLKYETSPFRTSQTFTKKSKSLDQRLSQKDKNGERILS